MKLHNTLIEILLKTYEVNSGWTEEKKLRQALENLDIAVYTQANGTKVLVDAKQMRQAFSDYQAQVARSKNNRGE
tara:strand:- start:165 stop:389 length:225 start_codon:yes stop_codon:yes gene_type:complete